MMENSSISEQQRAVDTFKKHEKQKIMSKNDGFNEGMIMGIENHDINVPAQYYKKPIGVKLKTQYDLLDKLSTLMANRDKNVA